MPLKKYRIFVGLKPCFIIYYPFFTLNLNELLHRIMANYEIVAFYRENEREVAEHAGAVSRMYHLQLRYEKVPRIAKAVSALLGQNTVLCIFTREAFGFRQLMKYVYALNKPVIITGAGYSSVVYNRLKVPVGYLQENKEKVVWANFFQRNNPSCEIELVIPKEKDEGIATMVRNNLKFIENIFGKSSARYIETFAEGSFEKNLKRIFNENSDSVVLIMRPFRVFSFYLPYNIRLFRKYAHSPVLVIPRSDSLYVPCH